MPLMRVETTVDVPQKKRGSLVAQLSQILAKVTRKPEQYCMVILVQGAAGTMAGREMAVAYVDVRGIGGFTPEVNAELSRQVAGCLCKELGLQEEGVYLTFTDVPGTNWGWKGRTFA